MGRIISFFALLFSFLASIFGRKTKTTPPRPSMRPKRRAYRVIDLTGSTAGFIPASGEGLPALPNKTARMRTAASRFRGFMFRNVTGLVFLLILAAVATFVLWDSVHSLKIPWQQVVWWGARIVLSGLLGFSGYRLVRRTGLKVNIDKAAIRARLNAVNFSGLKRVLGKWPWIILTACALYALYDLRSTLLGYFQGMPRWMQAAIGAGIVLVYLAVRWTVSQISYWKVRRAITPTSPSTPSRFVALRVWFASQWTRIPSAKTPLRFFLRHWLLTALALTGAATVCGWTFYNPLKYWSPIALAAVVLIGIAVRMYERRWIQRAWGNALPWTKSLFTGGGFLRKRWLPVFIGVLALVSAVVFFLYRPAFAWVVLALCVAVLVAATKFAWKKRWIQNSWNKTIVLLVILLIAFAVSYKFYQPVAWWVLGTIGVVLAVEALRKTGGARFKKAWAVAKSHWLISLWLVCLIGKAICAYFWYKPGMWVFGSALALLFIFTLALLIRRAWQKTGPSVSMAQRKKAAGFVMTIVSASGFIATACMLHPLAPWWGWWLSSSAWVLALAVTSILVVRRTAWNQLWLAISSVSLIFLVLVIWFPAR